MSTALMATSRIPSGSSSVTVWLHTQLKLPTRVAAYNSLLLKEHVVEVMFSLAVNSSVTTSLGTADPTVKPDDDIVKCVRVGGV
jgi:hypothetical protein